MTLAMSWDEWTQHDGTALAGRVRAGELTPRELASQAASAVAKVDPALCGVVELFDDVIADPARDGADLSARRNPAPRAGSVDSCGPLRKRWRATQGELTS